MGWSTKSLIITSHRLQLTVSTPCRWINRWFHDVSLILCTINKQLSWANLWFIQSFQKGTVAENCSSVSAFEWKCNCWLLITRNPNKKLWVIEAKQTAELVLLTSCRSRGDCRLRRETLAAVKSWQLTTSPTTYWIWIYTWAILVCSDKRSGYLGGMSHGQMERLDRPKMRASEWLRVHYRPRYKKNRDHDPDGEKCICFKQLYFCAHHIWLKRKEGQG